MNKKKNKILIQLEFELLNEYYSTIYKDKSNQFYPSKWNVKWFNYKKKCVYILVVEQGKLLIGITR